MSQAKWDFRQSWLCLSQSQLCLKYQAKLTLPTKNSLVKASFA